MVTQKQIAEKLGISRQLVSFALGGYPQVSEDSRKRILDAAVQMGYRPNPHARALKQQRTGIVALWIPELISTHYMQVARELNHLAKPAGYEMIIIEVGTVESEGILSHVPVDAIFAVETPKQARIYLDSAMAKSVPLFSLGASCCNDTDYIKIDLAAGTEEAMKHLISSGYRRIVHATFLGKGFLAETSRKSGYQKAMKRAGLKPEFLSYPLSDKQRETTRCLVKDYVKQNGVPEAIFCHSDDVALGIYRGLCDLNLRVPQDVALVGCDGIEDTEYLECPLTTLVQPVSEMCSLAWQFLGQRLDKKNIKKLQTVLKPTLVIRESSQQPEKQV